MHSEKKLACGRNENAKLDFACVGNLVPVGDTGRSFALHCGNLLDAKFPFNCHNVKLLLDKVKLPNKVNTIKICCGDKKGKYLFFAT